MAIGFAVLGIAITALIIADSLAERQIDLFPQRLTSAKQHRITIDAIDPDLRILKVHVSTQFWIGLTYGYLHDHGIVKSQEEFDSKLPSITARHGPLVIRDLIPYLDLSGLRNIQPKSDEHNSSQELSTLALSAAKAELTLSGNPVLYPFDHYTLAGKVHSDTVLTVDGKQYPLPNDESLAIESDVSGFVLRSTNPKTLENWKSVADDLNDLIAGLNHQPKPHHTTKYDANVWSGNQIALTLKRPFFLKALTVFLGSVALLSMVILTFASEPKQLMLNSVGYFLALWAVRNALSIGAPRTATLVDYGVLVLYATQVILLIARQLWEWGSKPMLAKEPAP